MKKTFRRITKPIALAAIVLALFAACDIFIFLGGVPDPTRDLTIELTWNGSQDLDLYVTFPQPSDGTMNNTPIYSTITDAYDSEIIGPDLGFFPEDDVFRDSVSQSNTSDSYNDTVVYSISAEGSNTQAIEVDGIPFNYVPNFNTSGNPNNGLASGYTYAWVGVMEVYVWAPSGKVSDADDVQVTVYQGSTAVGTYVIPENTTVEGASLVRIPLLSAKDGSTERNSYQILAHTQLLTSSSQIRGIEEPAVIGDYHVINVMGSKNE